jgi:hypothetical protein
VLIKILVSLLLTLAPSAWAQDRFTTGEFKGFTKSPTEGVIIHLDEPVTVRAVTGTVVRSVGDESPLENTLIELRGLNDSKIVGAARTDPQGRFHVSGIPPGTYTFKAISLGFQSVVGTVIVSSKAGKSRVLDLRLKPGV